MTDRDHSLDTLLELDGVMYTVDDTGCCWVKFEVARIAVSPERPHGLKYSLTLHDEKGTRLLGFDNAHPVRKGAGPAHGRGSSTTTSTPASASGFTITWMPRRCLQTSGPKSKQ
jgi:hypothetical protein